MNGHTNPQVDDRPRREGEPAGGTWWLRLLEVARVESWAPCAGVWCAVRTEGSGQSGASSRLPLQPCHPHPGSPQGHQPPHRRLLGGWLPGQVEARGLGWGPHLFSQGGLLGQEVTVGRKQTHGRAQTDGIAGGDRHTAMLRDDSQRSEGGQPGQKDRCPLHLERGGRCREAGRLGQAAPHLGEAGSAAPRRVAGVWGHTLGGLIVLGELQGGSRLMTKRPQAAMLRFIWEALRKSWPGSKRGAQSRGLLTGPALHPTCTPSPLHTSAFRENAFLPLQPGPLLNDRVTEGHLRGHGAGQKTSPLPPYLPRAPPHPPGSQPKPPISVDARARKAQRDGFNVLIGTTGETEAQRREALV